MAGGACGCVPLFAIRALPLAGDLQLVGGIHSPEHLHHVWGHRQSRAATRLRQVRQGCEAKVLRGGGGSVVQCAHVRMRGVVGFPPWHLPGTGGKSSCCTTTAASRWRSRCGGGCLAAGPTQCSSTHPSAPTQQRCHASAGADPRALLRSWHDEGEGWAIGVLCS